MSLVHTQIRDNINEAAAAAGVVQALTLALIREAGAIKQLTPEQKDRMQAECLITKQTFGSLIDQLQHCLTWVQGGLET